MFMAILIELLYGNEAVDIPTYVGRGNSDALYRVVSINSVAREKRLKGFLESNIVELFARRRLRMGCAPGKLNASNASPKSPPSDNLSAMLTQNKF